MGLRLAWLTLLLVPCGGFAADLVFSGSLERVGHESISIRLSDRRVIDARLPSSSLLQAEAVAAQYEMGDRVQMTCKAIQPVWEAETASYQSLELTQLQRLRKPLPEELSKMPPLPPWRAGVNLLRGPSAPPPDRRPADEPPLAHAREVNLKYAANMPNFVADETAKRYTGNGTPEQWRSVDTIETEISFKRSGAVRQRIRKDGVSWERPFQSLPGFKWSGGFGTEIRPLFDPQCPTTIEYEGRAEVRGKRVLKYRFGSPPDGCFAPFYFDYQRYNPARTGHAFLDEGAGNLVQLDEAASEFPAEFEFAERKEEVSWDYVKIGDASHLLPVGASFVVRYSSGSRWRVEVEYKNHRHFEASTSVTFQ
ncbi:MAG: hypothetical protein ABSF12_08325 [Bryobacteraceae bacterium]|jgi:hypothetical protein